MVEATSPSLERGSLPQLLRHPSKESKAEETRNKGKMITKEEKKILRPLLQEVRFGNFLVVLERVDFYRDRV